MAYIFCKLVVIHSEAELTFMIRGSPIILGSLEYLKINKRQGSLIPVLILVHFEDTPSRYNIINDKIHFGVPFGV